MSRLPFPPSLSRPATSRALSFSPHPPVYKTRLRAVTLRTTKRSRIRGYMESDKVSPLLLLLLPLSSLFSLFAAADARLYGARKIDSENWTIRSQFWIKYLPGLMAARCEAGPETPENVRLRARSFLRRFPRCGNLRFSSRLDKTGIGGAYISAGLDRRKSKASFSQSLPVRLSSQFPDRIFGVAIFYPAASTASSSTTKTTATTTKANTVS